MCAACKTGLEQRKRKKLLKIVTIKSKSAAEANVIMNKKLTIPHALTEIRTLCTLINKKNIGMEIIRNKDRQKIFTPDSRCARQTLISSETVQPCLSYASAECFRTYIKINTEFEQVTKPSGSNPIIRREIQPNTIELSRKQNQKGR